MQTIIALPLLLVLPDLPGIYVVAMTGSHLVQLESQCSMSFTTTILGMSWFVVSRYFGGIKLGTGGLVRAYSQVVKDAVAAVPLRKFTEKVSLNIRFSYQYEGAVRRFINKVDGVISSSGYGEAVTFLIEMDKEVKSFFVTEIKNITNGSVLFLEEI